MLSVKSSKNSAQAPAASSLLINKLAHNNITDSALSYYSSVKSANRLFGYSLGMAESTLKWVSNPVVRRVDSYALLAEAQLSKASSMLLARGQSVQDMYSNVRFLMDVSSSLAVHTFSELRNLSIKDVYASASRLNSKLKSREAIVSFIEEDLVSSIWGMSDIITCYMTDLKVRATSENHAALSNIISTVEEGLKSILVVLPPRHEMGTVDKDTKAPLIKVTPSSPSTSGTRANRSGSLPKTATPEKEMEKVMEIEQTSETKEDPLLGNELTVPDAEPMITVNQPSYPSEVLPASEEQSDPTNPDEISPNVYLVDAEDLTKDDIVSLPIKSKSIKRNDKKYDAMDMSAFPELPHTVSSKKTWADIAHSTKPSEPALQVSEVPTIIDLSSLDHEKQFSSRKHKTIPAEPTKPKEAKPEKVEEFPALSEKSTASNTESASSDYLEAATHFNPAHDTEWKQFHSRHTGPVIGHARPSISKLRDANPFDALAAIEQERSGFASFQEEVDAVHARLEMHQERHRKHADGHWHTAAPKAKDSRHHFAHDVQAPAAVPLRSHADSNPYAAFVEESDIEIAHMNKANVVDQLHELEVASRARGELLEQLQFERKAATKRLRGTKKLEECERERRCKELAKSVQSPAALAQERKNLKQQVIRMEDEERMSRFAEYMSQLRASIEIAKEQAERDQHYVEALSDIDNQVARFNETEQVLENKELAISLEEEERERRISETQVLEEVNQLERKINLATVRKLEEAERQARVAELEARAVGSPVN